MAGPFSDSKGNLEPTMVRDLFKCGSFDEQRFIDCGHRCGNWTSHTRERPLWELTGAVLCEALVAILECMSEDVRYVCLTWRRKKSSVRSVIFWSNDPSASY